MKQENAVLIALGGLGLVWLWKRASTPRQFTPDTDTAGLFGEPSPNDTGKTPPPMGPQGVSLGWAPVPVREAVDVQRWEAMEPTCGRFYRVRKRDSIESIASNAVRLLAVKAAKDAGYNDATAKQWADRAGSSYAVVREATDSLCSGWNDELYGHANVERVAPWGRGVDTSARHDDVRDAIARGRTPRRNLDSSGTPTVDGRTSRPWLWIPRWSGSALLQALDTPGACEPIQSTPWEDGSSGTWPPPSITERGVIYGKV